MEVSNKTAEFECREQRCTKTQVEMWWWQTDEERREEHLGIAGNWKQTKMVNEWNWVESWVVLWIFWNAMRRIIDWLSDWVMKQLVVIVGCDGNEQLFDWWVKCSESRTTKMISWQCVRRMGWKTLCDEMTVIVKTRLIEHAWDGFDKENCIFDNNNTTNFSFGQLSLIMIRWNGCWKVPDLHALRIVSPLQCHVHGGVVWPMMRPFFHRWFLWHSSSNARLLERLRREIFHHLWISHRPGSFNSVGSISVSSTPTSWKTALRVWTSHVISIETLNN